MADGKTESVNTPIIVIAKFLTLLMTSVALSACLSGKVVRDADQNVSEARWRSDKGYFLRATQPGVDASQWRYSAKVGLTTNTLSEQANLVWRYDDQSNDVRLFGPLGVGAIKIEFDQYGVQLNDSRGVLYRGISAQRLLTDVVGWPLPIDALSRWLFVQPDLAQPFQYKLNNEGQITAIRQLGWQIDYSHYRDYQGRALPRTLIAYKEFDGNEHGVVRVKLVTKAWQW